MSWYFKNELREEQAAVRKRKRERKLKKYEQRMKTAQEQRERNCSILATINECRKNDKEVDCIALK